MFHRRYKILRMRINICDPMTLSWPQWKRQRKHLKCNSMFILFCRYFCCDSFYIEIENYTCLMAMFIWKLECPFLLMSLTTLLLATGLLLLLMESSTATCSTCIRFAIWVLALDKFGSWRIHFKIHLSCCFHLSMLFFYSVLCGIPLMLYCNLIC